MLSACFYKTEDDPIVPQNRNRFSGRIGINHLAPAEAGGDDLGARGERETQSFGRLPSCKIACTENAALVLDESHDSRPDDAPDFGPSVES
jgi:hypothetical protein